MYVRRMSTPMVVLCAVVLSMLVCGWAGADVLLSESFEGNVGWDITNYGGGNHWQATYHEAPHTVVSNTIIDSGNSAYANESYNVYKRVSGYFTQHTLAAGESVEATWVEQLTTTGGTQTGISLLDSAGRFWRLYLARNTWDGGQTFANEWIAYAYDSTGGQHYSSYPYWSTLPLQYGTTLDAKIVVTTTEAHYYVKAHGAANYDELWSYAGGMSDIANIELCMWGGATYVDSIVVQTQVPEPGSLAALGVGLVGMAGFVHRRRRS